MLASGVLPTNCLGNEGQVGEGPAFRIDISPEEGPDGLRVIEDWKVQGLAFPRTICSDVNTLWKSKRFERAGVYVLWNFGFSEVYVGEANKPLDRVGAHEKGTTNRWKHEHPWTHAAAFVGKDLNQAHARYVEDKLYHLAEEANLCELAQSRPGHDLLSDSDTTKAKHYLRSIRLCLQVLGVNFFEKGLSTAPPTPKSKDQEPVQLPEGECQYLVLEAKGIRAQGYHSTEGFVVLPGSQVVKEEVPSFHNSHYNRERRKFLKESRLKDKGTVYELVGDYYEFPSPTAAASVLLGVTRNSGSWKPKA